MLSRIKCYLKELIKFIIQIFDHLVKSQKQIIPKTLLLIRVDAIGDYILFRNFIKYIKDTYTDYKITLVGNIAWKSLSLEFDNELFENWIWIHRKKFLYNLFYRNKTLRKITSQGYEIVISPVYSREFFYSDTIVKLVTAKEKIGSEGDFSNITKKQKKISDQYFTKLISADKNIVFEFYRNKEFFENFFSIELNILRPEIILKPRKLEFNLPSKYAVLFIGASANFRKWSIGNFVQIGLYLKEKYGMEVIVCGAKSDLPEARQFNQLFGKEYIDLVNKTSLIELLHIIDKSHLLIANETSAPHFAVALNKQNLIVISNGNHFGRFTPYPKDIFDSYHVVYHPYIESKMDYTKELIEQFGMGSNLNINEITAARVVAKIDDILIQ